MMLPRDFARAVSCAFSFVASITIPTGCGDDPQDFVELVAVCASHSGGDDDPCPRGCAQVRRVRSFELEKDGTCDPMSIGQAPFCAPGRASDFEPINDSWYPMQRLDLVADPEGTVLVEPEEVLIINSPEDPPGWRNCPIDTSSELCQCAFALVNDGV
jgi:hypothetical protein